jgi:hypothetical protein
MNARPMRYLFAQLARERIARQGIGPAMKDLLASWRSACVARWAEEIGKTRAVALAAEKFDVTEKTIWNDVKRWPVRWPVSARRGSARTP